MALLYKLLCVSRPGAFRKMLSLPDNQYNAPSRLLLAFIIEWNAV